ncbi:MAG: hypothetical protein WDN28_21065 [Chthoniobacter sp.]
MQVVPYVGSEVLANPSLTNDIATAWTVVDPDHAHYVATAVAFNSPGMLPDLCNTSFDMPRSPMPVRLPNRVRSI